MSDNRQKTTRWQTRGQTRGQTRRQFLGLAAVGTAGATVGSLGERPEAAETVGRAHYEVFQPGEIGRMKLKNRLCRSAAYMNSGSWHPETEGEVTDDTIRIHRAYAEGEVAMTMTGYMAVMDYGKKGTHVCASHDRYIPGLARLAEAIHGVGNDCKIVAEIGHDGTASTGTSEYAARTLSPTGVEWSTRISPSGINWRGEEEGHTLSAGEIERFCSDMGEAARRLKEAGFDGCNLHGAHHYLINTFLSPFTNRRTDRYGGSMEKRVEIVREIVQQIRDRVGESFAIIIKLNCDDGPVDDGTEEAVDIDTFPRMAGLIERAGVDAIDVSGYNPIRTGIDDPEDQSYYREYTAKLDGVGIPVMLSGGNRNVDLLEEIFKKQEGKIDFFNFARPLIRQPYLIKQWLEGGDPHSECINSTLCFRAMYRWPPRPAYCVVLERQRQAEREARSDVGAMEGGVFGA